TGVASLWAWNPIPDQVSNTCKIKIVDADNSTVLDESNAAFHIAASFTVNTPADGNVLVVDDSFDITWARVGTAVTTVKLEYSANGGTDWILINSASNSGIYPWTVPNAISTSCKVRVSDPNNATANDQSEGYFKIKGALQVTSPNAGTESWNVGSTYPITWTRNGSVSTINIYYSYDNGTNWVKLNTLAVDGSLGTWNWTISEAIQSSSSALIKIIDTSDSTVYDSSNNKFEVKGSLSLTTPSNAGIVLSVSDPYTISWTKYGAIANIEIHYSTNGGITGGGTYPNLIATVPASDLSYGWTVPDSVGTNLRIRVRAVDNTNVWDESDNTFGIKGKITVNQPDGGETLFVGDTAQIKWTPVGTYSQVRLEYSTNAFSDELQTHSIAAVSAGSSGVQQSYDWTVADAIGSNVKIRASDLNNSAVADVSNAVFSVKGKLQVTVPNGAEVWKVGEQRSITWNRTGSVANVKLEHSIDGGTSYAFVIVASTDASTGSYAWTLPDRIGLQNKIRVSDADDASVNDVSDANFTIKGKLTVTAPNGSEVWHVSQHESITWTKTGTIAAVKLEYSTNGFSDELKTVTIAGGVDAVSGTPYDWTIPDALSNTVKVRVTNEADDTVADVSDTNFKIAGGIIVTSPNGTEEWTVGATQSITWSLSGSIQNVKLEYSTDSGSTYPNTIIGSAPAAGLSYSWVGIPNSVSKQVRVRVADASDVSVFDVSNADFTIMPGFNLIVPNGGEVWTVDASQDITWTTTGTCSNVKLEYSTNSGANYTTIVASTANTETYAWTVPNAISTT
ncbi:MAG: hypothetical protein PHO30_00535, partial [Candidatus Omnitrophica bacterium]|nr:hypothetical protein [Candidatus Omnitrophota bacterium]